MGRGERAVAVAVEGNRLCELDLRKKKGKDKDGPKPYIPSVAPK